MQPQVYIYWEDNKGAEASQRFHLPGGETVGQSIARVNALRSALLPLSNARLTSARLVYRDVVDALGVAAGNSNVLKNLVCLLANGEERGTIKVPSPRPDLPYDSTGPWAGIRITRQAMVDAGLAGPVETALQACVWPWGDPFPTEFVVAGIDFVP